MKVFIPSVVIAGATFLFAVWCQAEQPITPRDQTMQALPASSSPAPALAYAPPHRGAPAPGRRIGGGTRSFGKKGPLVSVLAPDHMGLTVQEQPALYWYVSETVTTPVEIEVTLIEEDGIKPVLKTRIPSPVGPGIQRVNLAEHQVHLTPGARYEWSVSLVLDPKRRSRDIVASGGIERVANGSLDVVPGENLPKSELPGAYAQAGLWYDTIASVSDLIDTSPTDPAFRQQRATLLETAGLKEASAFDRETK
jgi:hypothetical protein